MTAAFLLHQPPAVITVSDRSISCAARRLQRTPHLPASVSVGITRYSGTDDLAPERARELAAKLIECAERAEAFNREHFPPDPDKQTERQALDAAIDRLGSTS